MAKFKITVTKKEIEEILFKTFFVEGSDTVEDMDIRFAWTTRGVTLGGTVLGFDPEDEELGEKHER